MIDRKRVPLASVRLDRLNEDSRSSSSNIAATDEHEGD